MSYYRRLIDNARTRCPGAIEEVIELDLWNIVDEACREGWIMIDGISVNLTTEDLEYDLTPASHEDYRIVHVIALEHDTYDTADIIVEDQLLTLPKLPTEEEASTNLRVQAAVVPNDNAVLDDALDNEFLSRNFQLLLHGLVGRLMAHMGKPYTNIALAQYHTREFRSGYRAERRRLRMGDELDKRIATFPRHTM